MTKRQMRSRLKRAKKEVKKQSKIVELAQRRKNYWSKIADAMEYRLDAVERGQLEMKLD